jgi:hypothetical protein
MKSFKQHLTENTEVEQIVNHWKGTPDIVSQLQKVLGPKYIIKARLGMLGVSSGQVGLYLDIWGENPNFNIARNSPVYTSLSLWYKPGTPYSWEGHPPRAIKYRKITSKISLEDANKKLVEWFRKNKPAYDALM